MSLQDLKDWLVDLKDCRGGVVSDQAMPLSARTERMWRGWRTRENLEGRYVCVPGEEGQCCAAWVAGEQDAVGPLPDWETGPLPAIAAVRVWCAAAGAAGAYVPAALAEVATAIRVRTPEGYVGPIPDGHVGPIPLAAMLDEAVRRASWRDTTHMLAEDGGWVERESEYGCRSASLIDDDTLLWATSVYTLLTRTDEGWFVRIHPYHAERVDAAIAALASLREAS